MPLAYNLSTIAVYSIPSITVVAVVVYSVVVAAEEKLNYRIYLNTPMPRSTVTSVSCLASPFLMLYCCISSNIHCGYFHCVLYDCLQVRVCQKCFEFRVHQLSLLKQGIAINVLYQTATKLLKIVPSSFS